MADEACVDEKGPKDGRSAARIVSKSLSWDSYRDSTGGTLRKFVFLFGLAACASAQSDMRSTITFGAGVAQNVGPSCCGDTAASFSGSYAYRVIPHVDLEAGVNATTLLGTEARGANYDIKADDHLIWVPFGIKGVLPRRNGRQEIFLGAGGLYERYSAGNSASSVGSASRDGWGGYASFGAAFTLDQHRRFWLGGSSHIFFANTNSGYAHDRWFVANLDFGVRF